MMTWDRRFAWTSRDRYLGDPLVAAGRLVTNHRHETYRKFLGSDRWRDGRFNAVPCEQFGDLRSVDEDVVVTLIVSTP